MKFKLIYQDERLEKLYYEVVGTLFQHDVINRKMDSEAWENGMRANAIDESERF